MSDDIGHPNVASIFQRAELLRQQGRLDDAINGFKQALQVDANHAQSYMLLALCYIQKGDKKMAYLALDAAQRAVALMPEDSTALGICALAMSMNAKEGQSDKLREALEVARQAVSINPDSAYAHSVVGNILLSLKKYPEAEVAARKALELDVESAFASEVLSASLVMQGKSEDLEGLVQYRLDREPDDDSAHNSAGYHALMTGDHQKANHHFMEALRIYPMNDSARAGLVQSFRARSVLYRNYLRFVNFMNKFTEGRQTLILVGGFIAYRLLYGAISQVSPILGGVVVFLWLCFAFWSFLAKGLSTFMLAFDRFARHALEPKEFWEGIGVGSFFLLSLATAAAGLLLNIDSGYFAGLASILVAVVLAVAFNNSHYIGKYLYGAVGVFAVLGWITGVLMVFTGMGTGNGEYILYLVILSGVIVSWLRAFRVMFA